MKLTISVLFYGKPDVSRKFLQYLEPGLKNRPDVEVIIRDNGCIGMEQSASAVLTADIKNIVYIPSGINLGFGAGHNENLKLARGEFFLCMNNDLFMQDNSWVNKLLMAFSNGGNASLVGLQGVPCELQSNMRTLYIEGKKGDRLDYIEGAFFCGRTKDFQKYGLFSPAFKIGLFEDGDLSLRFKQMGFEISVLKIAHQHLRAQSLSLFSAEERERIADYNCEIFKKRWGTYMQNQRFANRVLIKAESAGIGDILAITPVVEAVRRDHPTAIIEVTTSCPDLFINNKHLTELYKTKREYPNSYDRVVDLKINYASYEPMVKEAERVAVTKFNSYLPQIFLTKLELEEGRKVVESVRRGEGQTVVGVQLQNNRPAWEGKSWDFQHIAPLIKMIQGIDSSTVIEFGKDVQSSGEADLDLVNQTDLREYLAIVANLDVMVCIDSLPLHASQAFGIPTFCIFGATSPLGYVIDWKTVFPIQCPDLECLGCYQRKGDSGFNKCAVGFQHCMHDLSPERVFETLVTDRDILLERNIEYLSKHLQYSGPE
jgi:ADP-heptose:LPS heptosyltransferase